MNAQSSKHFGPNHHIAPSMLLFTLCILTIAFGIRLYAESDSFLASTSSNKAAPAALEREALKDAWIERGTGLALAAYNPQTQEALKDFRIEGSSMPPAARSSSGRR